MSTPKLTVGIPTFNRSTWLKQTIDSVLAQNYTGFRLIVSDNASDDGTPEVVRSFEDERIDYLRSERNVGPIGNLNRLIVLADTEFLLLLPDDDILYPGHLSAAVDVLDRCESVGLAHSAFDLIDERSRPIRRAFPVAACSPVTIEPGDQALERLMVSSWPICFSSTVYRTKAIVEAGGFREREEPFGDLQLWMRIALAWDFGYIAQPLAGFRVHPQAVSLSVGAAQGVTSAGRELSRVHTDIRFQRRMNFIDGASLEPRQAQWLRALATLQDLVERSILGLPWTEVSTRLIRLAWTYPRILRRPRLWRLALSQLGGRRVRSALRAALTRTR